MAFATLRLRTLFLSSVPFQHNFSATLSVKIFRQQFLVKFGAFATDNSSVPFVYKEKNEKILG